MTSRDELGQLAEPFNVMARHLQEYRESTTDEIVRLHSTVESMLRLSMTRRLSLPIMAPWEWAIRQRKSLPKWGLRSSCRDHFRPSSRGRGRPGGFFAQHLCEGHDVPLGRRGKVLPAARWPCGTSRTSLFGVALLLHHVTRFRLMVAPRPTSSPPLVTNQSPRSPACAWRCIS